MLTGADEADETEEGEPEWQVALSTAICRLREREEFTLAQELADILQPVSV